MRRILLGVLVMATLVLPAASSWPAPTAPPTAPVTGPVPYDAVPNQILDLPDGDRIALGSPDRKRVILQRYDGATATWAAPEVLFRKKGVECGDLDARTSAGAVAVLLECERGTYYEDQAPTRSVALYTLTWQRHRLTGEAFEEPGIAPAGRSAVWPVGQGRYTTWTRAAGFADHRLRAPGEEYTLTAVVSDAEAVSYVYGARLRSARGCGLVVLTRTGDGPVGRQEVPLDDLGCSDTGLANVGADTLVAGDPGSVASQTTITRPAATAPFAVTAIAPDSAPGLFGYDRDDQRGNAFVTAPGLPLYSIGSPDRHRFLVQTYDPAAQHWGPRTQVFVSRTRCVWGDLDVAQTLDVIVADVDCGPHHLLTTTDGSTWRVLRLGRRTLGVSMDGAFVAVPGARTMTILSREHGAVRLPLPVTGRCSVVVPSGPDSAALLAESGLHRGWPTALSVSGPDGWTRDPSVEMPRPGPGRCRRIQTLLYNDPVDYYVGGRCGGYLASITLVDGRWRVRSSLF